MLWWSRWNIDDSSYHYHQMEGIHQSLCCIIFCDCVPVANVPSYPLSYFVDIAENLNFGFYSHHAVYDVSKGYIIILRSYTLGDTSCHLNQYAEYLIALDKQMLIRYILSSVCPRWGLSSRLPVLKYMWLCITLRRLCKYLYMVYYCHEIKNVI